MDKKIDLLNSKLIQPEIAEKTPIASNKSLGTKKFKPLGFILIFLLAVYIIFSFSGAKSSTWFFNLPIISQIKHLVESAETKLKGEADDRINILLLGIGGKKHDGGLLTDTII